MNFRTSVLSVLLAILLIVTAGCSAQSSSGSSSKQSKKDITLGFNPGPYQEEFEKGVAPYLKKKGYKIHYKNFTDGVQVNVAVAQGAIDANVMQHPVFMESVNKQEGLHNTGIVQVPTPPMGLYSGKTKTTSIRKGAVVAVPNQASNMYRALVVLQDLGWVKLRKGTDPSTASLKDVVENKHQLNLKPMDNAQEARALKDVDYAVIQGNFAVSSGMKLSSALQLEKMTNRFTNVVTVDEKNKNAQWAKDIVSGYHTQEFKHYIKSHAEYDGYHLPSYFNN
ncbi:MetQ/NlpA family ABC transporter substrate-binding protein [Sporolactobacillus terrae]|uniref:MetQ/NlpA family ABC transporter substrate-binding protein n=1 Tax=Sporolactobacillus terrae TaxID=269673 RepID=UPI00049039D1|nr:MetQ/NlpA family ABC transporter substrate-binding protein [Sporolactobacillus terrae]